MSAFQKSYQGTRVQPALLTNATLSSGPALRETGSFSASYYSIISIMPGLTQPAQILWNLPSRQDGRTLPLQALPYIVL